MKFGLGLNINETISEIVEKSVLAERLGIDYVWISDVPAQLYAPVVAAGVAENTKKLRIGLGLVSAFLHTPNQIAQSITTLIQTYGERFELCVGPGDRYQLQRVGVSTSSSKGVQGYFRGVKHQIEASFRKRQTRCKLWLGAQGPEMLKAARYYDGAMLNYASPDQVKWAIDRVGSQGRSGLHFGVYAPSYVYREFDRETYDLLRISSAVVALGAADSVLRRLDLFGSIAESKRKMERGASMSSVVKSVPKKTIELFSIFKSQSELKDYLTELSKSGVEHVVFSYPQNWSKKSVTDLALALKKLH